MTVEYRTGDLFTQDLPALGHGVNVCSVMAAGIAREFRRRWPGLYEPYRQACHSGALKPGGVLPYWAADGTLVYNLASQDRPGRHASLRWVREALTAMLGHAEDHHIPAVGIPQIGAGIGGLRWADVAQVVENVAGTSVVRVVVVSLPGGGR